MQQAWYLSTDLRVFQIEAGQHRFGASPGNTGDAVADATAYIAKVISNLNADPAVADGLFDAIAENEDAAALSLAPTNGSNPVYNFALARVRTQDTAAATDVRVFFRMWAAQQTNAVYDPSTTYASRTKGANRSSCARRAERRDRHHPLLRHAPGRSGRVDDDGRPDRSAQHPGLDRAGPPGRGGPHLFWLLARYQPAELERLSALRAGRRRRTLHQ